MAKTLTKYNFSQFLVEVERLEKENFTVNSICKRLATKYKSNPEALRKRLRRHRENVKKTQKQKKGRRKKGKNILSTEEEAGLVTLLKAAALSNHAMSKREIKQYVQETYKHAAKGMNQWLRYFMKRNKQVLKDKPLKIISSARVEESSVESTEQFLECMKEKRESFSMRADNVVNNDEIQLKFTGHSAGRGKITAVRPMGDVHKQITTEVRGGCCGSLIAFTCADGSLLFSALCLKPDGKLRKKSADGGDAEMFYIESDASDEIGVNSRNRPIPQIRIYTESGMIDSECWDIIYTAFIEHLRNITPGKPYLVLMDNLPQHLKLESIQKGLNENVDTIFLVKGSSQYSQPNDQYPFGTFRKEMNKQCSSDISKNISGAKLNQIIRDIVPTVMAKAFKPNLIKAAFNVTGMYPFDEEKIRKRCLENLGNLTDPENNTLSKVEEKAMHALKEMYKKEESKKANRKRKRAPVGLNQAYTSGHVIQGHEDERRKEEEETRVKQMRKEETETKKRENKQKKEDEKKAAQEKRIADRRNKEEAKRLEQESKMCNVCQKRKTARSKNWFKCENCQIYLVCSNHADDTTMHIAACRG